METAFAILAEPSRRAMLQLLAASERTVGEIERQLDLPQPSVSKHLRVLREAGIIDQRTEGTAKYNTLRRDDLEQRFPGLLDAVLNSAAVPA